MSKPKPFHKKRPARILESFRPKRKGPSSSLSHIFRKPKTGEDQRLVKNIADTSPIVRISVAPNQYFGRQPEKINSYQLTLTATIDRTLYLQAEKVKQFIKRNFPTDKAYLEDHSDTQAFHFLIFSQDYQTVHEILDHGFNGLHLRSNLDDREISRVFLLRKAKEYASKVKEV